MPPKRVYLFSTPIDRRCLALPNKVENGIKIDLHLPEKQAESLSSLKHRRTTCPQRHMPPNIVELFSTPIDRRCLALRNKVENGIKIDLHLPEKQAESLSSLKHRRTTCPQRHIPLT